MSPSRRRPTGRPGRASCLRRWSTALLAVTVVLLGLAACNPNQTVGQNVNRDAAATGSALGRAADTTGNAVGSAANATGRALDNAGTATRDTLDPPRGPAERAGRASDRATGTSY